MHLLIKNILIRNTHLCIMNSKILNEKLIYQKKDIYEMHLLTRPYFFRVIPKTLKMVLVMRFT